VQAIWSLAPSRSLKGILGDVGQSSVFSVQSGGASSADSRRKATTLGQLLWCCSLLLLLLLLLLLSLPSVCCGVYS